MRDSFVFYKSFRDAIKDLPADEQLKAYDAIFNYAFDDTEPEEIGVASMVLKFVKPQIDANNERYKNGQKGAEYGKMGGRPKKEKPQNNPTKTPPKPQENPTETPNVNVKVNVNDNDNEKIGGPLGTPGAYFPNDPELDQAFSDFVEYRINNNKPIDIDQTKRKLWDISKGNRNDMIQILDESMAQGWTGIFPKRSERASPGKKNKFSFVSERDTDLSALEEELLGKKVT